MKSLFEDLGGTYTMGADGILYPNLILEYQEHRPMAQSFPPFFLISYSMAYFIKLSSNARQTSGSTMRIILSSSFSRDMRFALPYQTV